jgi:hypothetical protein
MKSDRFSQKFHTLVSPSDIAIRASQAFDFTQSFMTQRAKGPLAQLIEPYTAGGKQMKASIEILNEMSYGIIDDRLNRKARGEWIEGGEESKDLLELFMNTKFVVCLLGKL